MSSLIECLVDPNCHGMHDDNYHFQYEKDAAVTQYDPSAHDVTGGEGIGMTAVARTAERNRVNANDKLDTWKVTASSGDYTIEAETVGHAYLRFVEAHPDDFVHAIINGELDGYPRPESSTSIKSFSDSNVRGD